MSRATLTGRAAPELGPGWRCVVVDCPHATTTVHLNAGPVQLTDTDAARVALARHDPAEGCACTRELRAHYGQPTLSERAAAPPRRRRR